MRYLHEAGPSIANLVYIASFLRHSSPQIHPHSSPLTKPNSAPITRMSVRTVGIARAPAGLSSAEFNARVQGVADTLLALPIAASAITKHELVR
jgi:hypothetical protein